jgi:protein O-mannosyl-transferase
MQKSIKTYKLSDKYLHYLILGGIILLTLIIYRGSLKNGFTNWDDKINITENNDLQNLSISGIVKMFSSLCLNTYEPLNILTRSLIYNFFGLNTIAFHLLNIFIHLLNIILVYLVIYKLTCLESTVNSPQTSNNRIKISGLVACLFAIHPMHTEPVCWLGGLDNLLYSFFYIASIVFYLKYIQTPIVHSPQSTDNIKQTAFIFNKNYLLSLSLFIISILSKPMALTLPVILILLDYYKGSWKLEAGTLKYWLKKLPFFLIALVFGIITILSEKYTGTSNDNYTQYSLVNRFFLLTYSVSFYVIYLIAPLKLSAIHFSPEIINGFLPLKYYLSPLLIFSLIALIWKSKSEKRKAINKEILFGTLFFLFTISVTLIAGKVRYGQVAERYTYIPYLGFFYIIAMFVSPHSTFHIPQKKGIMKNMKVLIIIIFILCFSFISFNRNKVWASSLSLFNDVIEKYPRAYMPYYNRGLTKYNLGDKQGALDDFNTAIELNQKDVLAYYNRGNSKADLGYKQAAIQDYNKAIELDPKHAYTFNNRGNVKAKLGDKQGALEDFNRAIEIDPQLADAFNNRGNAKSDLGDKQGALKDYNQAIELNPKNPQAYNNRGIAKASLGDKEGAFNDFNKAIEFNSTYAIAYNNRGNAKYDLGDKDGACQDWRKAFELGYSNAFRMIKRNCE